jgi:hypothetical protein
MDTPIPAPPPAAQIVATGQKNEGDVSLAKELAEERRLRKERETRIAELENENHGLKSVGIKPTPVPDTKKKRGFLDGWTFFDCDEEEEAPKGDPKGDA